MNALSAPLRMGASRMATYEACPRQYLYKYVLKWRASIRSANLAFGTAVDQSMEQYLRGQHLGMGVDAKAVFVDAWQKTHATTALSFPSQWTPKSMEKLGRDLLEAFTKGWEAQGLRVLIDAKGEPLVQRSFDIDLGDNIRLTGKLDVVALTPWGKVRVPDFKTAAKPTMEGFSLVADQTLVYQFAVEAMSEELGIDEVDEVGFIEAIKQKTQSRVLFDEVAPRRPDDQVEEFLNKVRDTASLIRRGRFPRRAGMAYNSPCPMCDFRGHCWTGSIDDLDPASLTTPFPDVSTTPQRAVPRFVEAA